MSGNNFETEKVHANMAVSAGERRKAALAEIDEAKFSWFHAKACVVAGELRTVVAPVEAHNSHRQASVSSRMRTISSPSPSPLP